MKWNFFRARRLACLRACYVVAFVTIAALCLWTVPGEAVDLAKGVVKGRITDKNGRPASGVRVKVMDDDDPSAEEMASGFTDTNGNYQLRYEGKHWDASPSHAWTIWRPDIFIRVSAAVKGWCDDGEWDSTRRWLHLGDSGVTSNHPLRDDLTKNLRLRNYPLDDPRVQQFVDRKSMCCSVDFPFHYSCFGCAASGEKIEWGEFNTSRPLRGLAAGFLRNRDACPPISIACRGAGHRSRTHNRFPDKKLGTTQGLTPMPSVRPTLV